MTDNLQGLLWRNAEDIAVWCRRCESDLMRVLNGMQLIDSILDISISLQASVFDAAHTGISAERSISGEITIHFKGYDALALKGSVPVPYNGLFFIRRGRHIQHYIWRAWLDERPGFRFLKRTGIQHRDDIWWRLGLSNGRFVQAPLNKKKPVFRTGIPAVMGEKSCYPGWVNETITETYVPGARAVSKWNAVHKHAIGMFDSESVISEEEDLNFRILVTFPFWLRQRLIGLIAGAFQKEQRNLKRNALKKKSDSITETSAAVRDDLVTHTLRNIKESKSEFWDQLLPWKKLIKSGEVQWVEPINPVHAASLLTGLRRTDTPPDIVARFPAEYRQNHPSFRGRICPVQSPESKKVGISLHLARGARVDLDGRIHPAGNPGHDELGYGASLIPFYQHNDGARAMMGAKNLCQACCITGRLEPTVKTGAEQDLVDLVAPLSNHGIFSETTTENGSLALGRDLLVAYLPWNGWNIDDAIVVAEHLVNDGWFNIDSTSRPITERLKPGWKPVPVTEHTVLPQPATGMAHKGTVLFPGSLIANLGLETGSKSVFQQIRYTGPSPALLKEINFYPGTHIIGGVLEYQLAKTIELGIGDKIMGRHGNKGVIGTIVPDADMPRLPDYPELPESMRGRVPDILLNPHGVISRMNLGQLIETHIGWLMAAGIDPPALSELGQNIGKPLASCLDHSRIQDMLTKTGLDRYGRINLVLPGGRKTNSPVVVGFQHIVRLKHIPHEKSNARRGGRNARYQRGSGQPVRGRKFQGGQRIGEMEVWSLAAHRANALLSEVLGVKSDSRAAIQTNPEIEDNGFYRYFKDWLFALGIDLTLTGGQMSFRLLDSNELCLRIGPERRVRNIRQFEEAAVGNFRCKVKGKKKECNYQMPDDGNLTIRLTGNIKQSVTIEFGAFLENYGLSARGPVLLKDDDGHYEIDLFETEDNGVAAGKLNVLIASSEGTQLKAVIEPGSGRNRPKSWPLKITSLNLCHQYPVRKGKNMNVQDLITKLQEPKGSEFLLRARIACPEHPSVPIKADPPFQTIRKPVPGGFFDESIFGPEKFWGVEKETRWGFLHLPIDIDYSLEKLIGKAGINELKKKGIFNEQSALLPLKILPVLPARYRMPVYLNGYWQDSKLMTDGYLPIYESIEKYSRTSDPRKQKQALADLENQIASLYGMIGDKFKGKTGIIRKEGMGRRVDRSARLVMTPNPDLGWDEAGIPVAVLQELAGDMLMQWLDSDTGANIKKESVANSEATEEMFLELKEWRWDSSAVRPETRELGFVLWKQFLRSDTGKLIVLNRQPSLHRDSIQAFHPRPLPEATGHVVQVNPLCCKGFGADFDGDEIGVHWPISDKAQKEAQNMLPSSNLLSLASHRETAQYDQDFVLGMYWLTRREEGRKLLNSILGDECCENYLVSGMNASQGRDLILHLSAYHRHFATGKIEALLRAACRECTEQGVSFGYYDLLEIQQKLKKDVEKIFSPDPGTGHNSHPETAEVNKLLQILVNEQFQKILEDDDPDQPGRQFAAMAWSGARGKKQTRQLVAARGLLSPGSISFPCEASRFIFKTSLAEGLTPEEAFYASMNARSSMCDKKLGTPQAGYLTRKLVYALWPYTVRIPDCGIESRERSVANCLVKEGICSECYGRLPHGNLAEPGFPAGLIAAQSIGERGTQLSMQSFHTGERQVSMPDVVAFLECRENLLTEEFHEDFGEISASRHFVNILKSLPAYHGLDERHFELLFRFCREGLINSIACGPLSGRITFERQLFTLFLAAFSDVESADLSEPFAAVMFNHLISGESSV